jgi:hypothetical protein
MTKMLTFCRSLYILSSAGALSLLNFKGRQRELLMQFWKNIFIAGTACSLLQASPLFGDVISAGDVQISPISPTTTSLTFAALPDAGVLVVIFSGIASFLLARRYTRIN